MNKARLIRLFGIMVIGFSFALVTVGMLETASATPPGPAAPAAPAAGSSGAVPTIIPSMPAGSIKDLPTLLNKGFNLGITASAVIFVILLLVGGIMYLTSAGNEQSTTKAKKLIIDALIGLIIVLASWATGNYVLDKLGVNVSLTNSGGTPPAAGGPQANAGSNGTFGGAGKGIACQPTNGGTGGMGFRIIPAATAADTTLGDPVIVPPVPENGPIVEPNPPTPADIVTPSESPTTTCTPGTTSSPTLATRQITFVFLDSHSTQPITKLLTYSVVTSSQIDDSQIGQQNFQTQAGRVTLPLEYKSGDKVTVFVGDYEINSNNTNWTDIYHGTLPDSTGSVITVFVNPKLYNPTAQ